jgi:hypothetical protein
MHVVDTLRAIEAHVSGGNKDAGLKIFKTYVSMDKRLGPPKFTWTSSGSRKPTSWEQSRIHK